MRTFQQWLEDAGQVGASTAGTWADEPNGEEFERKGIRSKYITPEEKWRQKIKKSPERLYGRLSTNHANDG